MPKMRFLHECRRDLPNACIRARLLFCRYRLKKAGFFRPKFAGNNVVVPLDCDLDNNEASNRDCKEWMRKAEREANLKSQPFEPTSAANIFD
jgi:hypothetical protein